MKIKKIGLFILSIVVILGIGVSFADVIDYPRPYEEQSKTLACIIKDSDLEDYTILIKDYESGKIYELTGEICLDDAIWDAFLFDKSIDITVINKENIQGKGILIKSSKYHHDDTLIWFSNDLMSKKYRGAPGYYRRFVQNWL